MKIVILNMLFCLVSSSIWAACLSCNSAATFRWYDNSANKLHMNSTCTSAAPDNCRTEGMSNYNSSGCGACDDSCAELGTNGSGVVSCKATAEGDCSGSNCVVVPELPGPQGLLILWVFAGILISLSILRKVKSFQVKR